MCACESGGFPASYEEKEKLMATIEITAENFEAEVINSDKPVLLDFWAVWCGPCSALSPIVEEDSNEHPEIKVGKVNTDEQMALAQKFQINAIPTLILFKDGEFANMMQGAVPKAAVEKFIAS